MFLLNFNDVLEYFVQIAEGKEILIMFITSFLCLTEAVIPMLPLFVIVNFSIVLLKPLYLGPTGIILALLSSIVGSFLGHLLIFILIKSSFSKVFINKISKNVKVSQFTNWISNRSDVFMILVISNPYAPSSIINYAMGLVGFDTKRYIKVVFIGKVFAISAMGLFGILFEVGDSIHNFLWIFLIYGIVYLIVIIIKIIQERKKNNYEKNDY